MITDNYLVNHSDPQALQRLKNRLDYSSSHESSTSTSRISGSFRTHSSFSETVGTVRDFFWGDIQQLPRWGVLASRVPGQPDTRGNSRQADAIPDGKEMQTIYEPSVDLLHLLVCYDDPRTVQHAATARGGTKLFRLGLHLPMSDQAFFHMLSEQYHETCVRNQGSWASFYWSMKLRIISSIKFVHFGLYTNDLVNVHEHEGADKLKAFPKEDDPLYVWGPPKPHQNVPPLASNALVHLFHHPDHAKSECQDTFDIMPKRIDDRGQGETPGWKDMWGIQITESWNTPKMRFHLNCVFGAACIIVLIVLWSVKLSTATATAVGVITVGTYCVKMLDDLDKK